MVRGATAGFDLFATHLPASVVREITFTVKVQNRTTWPTIRATLDVGAGGSASLAGTVVARHNGWVTLSFPIPSNLADATIKSIGLTVIGTSARPTPLNLAVGQMQVLPVEATAPAVPALISTGPSARLDWSSHYQASSSYRIYGEIGGRYYLVGVTRGSSYATQGIILNRAVNGYTSYLIQEVDASGRSSPLPGPLATTGLARHRWIAAPG